MRIAVIGARGQLGSDLLPLLGEQAVALGHDDIELTDPATISASLDAPRPTHVINCAAYNLVDKAEDEPEAAFRVNAFGVRNLAQWCAARQVVLLHVSTDYVFGQDPSRATPLSETDLTGPVSVYGASKLSGEMFVRGICPQHFVVRTCGLYGNRAARGKGNFVETMLRLAGDRSEVRVVGDQYCTPTSTIDLALAISQLVQTEAFGVYHATSGGSCSWCEFAAEIFRLANLPVQAVPVTAAEYKAKARRPDYSVLDGTRLANLLGRSMPPWQDALDRYLKLRESR